MRKNPFYGNSGAEKASLSIGKLICRPCANARNREYIKPIDSHPARRSKARSYLSKWKRANKDKVNADTARRQLILRQAYPSWGNDFFIQEIYHLAQVRSEIMGVPWQVDHIVPLSSDLVCGWHWECNLQIVPAPNDLEKSNAVWLDRPHEDLWAGFTAKYPELNTSAPPYRIYYVQ